MNKTEDHYSYRVYADPKTAQAFDRERFGGSIGELVKQTQERLVFSTLPSVKGWKIIDVGAGTGRFTLPLLEAGAEVMACDASQHMLDVLQEKAKNPARLQARVIDAHALPFGDREFDCAITFRMLMHVVDWKKALGELCRVSRDWVVLDFPPRHGFLLLAPIWHRIRNAAQSYKTLPISELLAELDRNGFEVVAKDPGFFLPLVVHRVIGSPGFMRFSERVFAKSGLTGLAGSPFTLFARRKR